MTAETAQPARPALRRGLSKESFSLKTLKDDVVAGLVNAVISVPDGLATAALAGVSPVSGLYASAAGPIAGGFLQSSHMLAIATTSASAIAARQAVVSVPEDRRPAALFLLVLLTGVALVAFGLLRLGRLVRFVPYSVMQGFLFGVSLVLLLDQLAPLVGYSPKGGNELVQFWDLLTHPGAWSMHATVIGLVALAVVLLLNRTPLATWSTLVGLVVPTGLLLALGWSGVEQVRDIAAIPRGLPEITLPALDLLSVPLVTAALSLAAVIAIQGAGVSQSVDNPDGSRVDVSTDMLAQGVGNLASGLVGGIPVGGSVGQTALVIAAGAKSRWNEILCGLWMLVIILFLAPVIEIVPMPALGALMVVAALSSIKPADVLSIVRTNLSAAAGFLVTLVASLLLSVPTAVLLGVGLAVVWNLVRVSSDVQVRRVVDEGDGVRREVDAPEVLDDRQVCVLTIYGDLFFAGAQTLKERLPRADGVDRAAVVLRMRGVNNVGATLVDVLDEYADDLAESGGKLFLSGVNPEAEKELRASRKLDLDRACHLEPLTDVIGESTRRAVEKATAWVEGTDDIASKGGATRAQRPARAPQTVLPDRAVHVAPRDLERRGVELPR